MDARRVALLVVALLVVVAGCAGGNATPSASPAEENATADETATTAGNATTNTTIDETTIAETATTTESPNATLPPGVNTTGVEAPQKLVAAHRDALTNASFAFQFGANVSVGPASQWTVQQGTVAPNLSMLILHSRSIRHVDGETMRTATDLWANNSTVVVKYRRDNRTELRLYNRTSANASAYDETWAHLPRADLDSQVTQTWLVELVLTVGNYDLARTERRNGHRVAVLRATEPVAAANYTDLNATLVVDEEGRVRSLSLTAAYAGDNRTRVHYEFELMGVGDSSVVRPTWVEAAIPPNETAGDATTTVSGTATTTRTVRNATTTE